MNLKHLNASVIEQLKELMADDFCLLIETFIDEGNNKIDLLNKAVADADAELLCSAAHGFKGSALNLSAKQLVVFCDELEIMGKSHSTDGAMDLVDLVKQEFISVKNELQCCI